MMANKINLQIIGFSSLILVLIKRSIIWLKIYTAILLSVQAVIST